MEILGSDFYLNKFMVTSTHLLTILAVLQVLIVRLN